MKPLQDKSWNCWRRRGFTLVEVVASLMLLGTLLVGILAAHRRHAEQIRGAKARLAAVAAADRLLAQWREQGIWGAAAASGRLKDGSDMSWRWTTRTAPELRQLGASVGRLDIVSSRSPDERPLARVEILVTDVAQIPVSVLSE